MCGAALLAARACMAAGAGMVKIFTHEANRLIIQQALPEALLDTFDDTDMPGQISQKLTASLQWADIVAAGPAMGTDDTASDLLKHVLCYSQKEKALKGLVLDADAIRILAKNRELRQLLTDRCPQTPCILTPHMAEFAALAGLSVHDCIRNRTCLVQEQADLLGSVIVCKDARTLVARPSAHTDCDGHENHENSKAQAKAPQYLNVTGNSGMATAGSGDVLTGITAALLALDFKDKKESALSRSALFFARPECESGFAAAVAAVIIHAAAGDCARTGSLRGVPSGGDPLPALVARGVHADGGRRTWRDDARLRRRVLLACARVAPAVAHGLEAIRLAGKLRERVLQRTENVLAHPEHGGVGVIGEDGVRHAPVVAPGPGQVGKVAPVAVKPEEPVAPVGRSDDLLREPVTGRLQQLEVEEEVVGEEILLLFAGENRLARGSECANDGKLRVARFRKPPLLRVRQARHRLPYLVRLDGLAHLVGVHDLLTVEARHVGSALALLVEHAFLDEAADGLAYRDAARPAGKRHRTLGELLIRLEDAARQHAREMVVGFVAESHGSSRIFYHKRP